VTAPAPDPADRFWTRAGLRADLERLGLGAGDVVMAHGALRRVGPMLNGPDALIGALLDATSPGGTVLAYTDWDARYDELLEPDGSSTPPTRSSTGSTTTSSARS